MEDTYLIIVRCMCLGGGIMIFEFCNGETRQNKFKNQNWLRNCLYVLENVEAEFCQECGERYFHATTLDAIDHYMPLIIIF